MATPSSASAGERPAHSTNLTVATTALDLSQELGEVLTLSLRMPTRTLHTRFAILDQEATTALALAAPHLHAEDIVIAGGMTSPAIVSLQK